ncbi:hypothetical protein [Caballeronia choica]|nr:hypothetical protein [Caballeronia choica]
MNWCYTTFREGEVKGMGVDLAKNVMQVHVVDGAGRVVVQKAIARERFVSWFANLEPCVGAASNLRKTDGLKLTTVKVCLRRPKTEPLVGIARLKIEPGNQPILLAF